MSRHLDAIEKLCFVCGTIFKKNGHSLSNESLSLQISERYQLKNLENQIIGKKVPTNICHSCFLNLRYYTSQRSQGKLCVTNQHPLPWTDPSNSICCRACLEYDNWTSHQNVQFMKKRKMVKKKFTGRTSAGSVWDVSKVVKGDARFEFLKDRSLQEKVISNMNDDAKLTCICIFCSSISTDPVELKCCDKSSCHSCLIDHLEHKKFISNTRCVSCSSLFTYETFVRRTVLEVAIKSLV